MELPYHKMNRAQLDTAYNNTLAVNNFPAMLADFQQRSQCFYAEATVQRNVPYSSAPRTQFDFFASGTLHAPTLIFIHGGYWQNCTKEDFAFIAEGLIKSHINVVLAEYTLAPTASMTQIVKEIGLLLDYLNDHQTALNITSGKVCLAGHSAGGHLTAMHRAHPLVSHAMPISALVDLRPISLCWLNEKLALTEEEIAAYSPINHMASGVPTAVHVGGDELPELIRQSAQYAHALKQCGNDVVYQPLAGHDHFSQLNEFKEKGQLTQSLLQLLSR